MSSKKISELPVMTVTAGTDVLPVVDGTDTITKKVTIDQITGQTIDVLTYASIVTLDFSAPYSYKEVFLTGDVEFQFSNLSAAKEYTLFIEADGTTRNITWPAGVRPSGSALPVTVSANKLATVSMVSRGTTAARVVAGSSTEP